VQYEQSICTGLHHFTICNLRLELNYISHHIASNCLLVLRQTNRALQEPNDATATAATAKQFRNDVLAMCDVLRDNDLPKAGIVLEDLANGKTRWFPVTSTAATPDNEVSVCTVYRLVRCVCICQYTSCIMLSALYSAHTLMLTCSRHFSGIVTYTDVLMHKHAVAVHLFINSRNQ
jgi:hypothetical protein